MLEIILSAFDISGSKNRNAETTCKVILLYCLFFSTFSRCLLCLDCCSRSLDLGAACSYLHEVWGFF